MSDINGVSAREMIQGLIAGKQVEALVKCARGRLKKKTDELQESLEGPFSERHRFLLKEIQSHITHIEQEIQRLDTFLLEAMQPYRKQWETLQTIPGVDEISAATVITEIGIDMNRFDSADHLASWAGMCSGNNQSGRKKKSERTTKGNRILRKTLCEVSHAAKSTNSQFKSKYQGLVIRRGHKRSIVAVGHKVLRVIYAILKNNKPYREPNVDYEALVVEKKCTPVDEDS